MTCRACGRARWFRESTAGQRDNYGPDAQRIATGRAKSDRGDARVLADLVRTDRHNHRLITPDSELHGAIRTLARAHHGLVRTRGRQTNALRSALREYYPGALAAFDELHHPDALAVLAAAPDPARRRGRIGAVRSSAWTWLFSSTHSTIAFSGGSR